MRIFLIKFGLFSLVVMASIWVLFATAPGRYTNAVYRRFTTPRQTSLILGTSRAAQAINPEVLNRNLGRTDFFNYSFTVGHSPYGPVYLESIRKKLDPQTKNGVFILTVDPWCVSGPVPDPNDSTVYPENELELATVKFVNLDPNIPFMLMQYPDPYYRLLLHRDDSYLHRNGWLEITVPMDSLNVQQRIDNQLSNYRDKLIPKSNFSSLRYKYLQTTIEFLKQHGEVYIVRLPVQAPMLGLEDEYMSDFEEKMKSMASNNGVEYLSLMSSNQEFRYTDGHHIYKGDSEKIGNIIGEWIKKESGASGQTLFP